VVDLDAMSHALRGIDVVYHLAGASDVDKALEDPLGTVRLNVQGTATVAEAARRNNLRRVVFASTVWVYGATVGESPLAESAPVSTADAGHIYTSTKLAGEMVLHSFAELYDLRFTILRYGIPYGPRMRDALVIAKFVQRALAGQPLTIAGDGLQVRNFVYVEDLARAHVLALDDAAQNEVLALDGAVPVTIREIAETVVELVGMPVEIERVPARPGDYAGRVISTERAAEVLGWQASTPFRAGVRRYLDWYLDQRVEEAEQAS
jgi:UDP-glucose 4-epimerase